MHIVQIHSCIQDISRKERTGSAEQDDEGDVRDVPQGHVRTCRIM